MLTPGCQELSGLSDLECCAPAGTVAGGASGGGKGGSANGGGAGATSGGNAGTGAGAAANGGSAGMSSGGSSPGGTSGAAGENSSGGSAGTPPVGGDTTTDCRSDVDCADRDGPCTEFVEGGFRACLAAPAGPNCPKLPGDDCCKDADCTGAGEFCAKGDYYASCSDSSYVSKRTCVKDECQRDADCAGKPFSFCAPRGAFGYPARRCVSGGCLRDSDCTAYPKGVCATVTSDCCITYGPVPGLFCSYPDDGGCRSWEDCPDDTPDDYEYPSCVLRSGVGKCTQTLNCMISGNGTDE
jgi:hypothetical protein